MKALPNTFGHWLLTRKQRLDEACAAAFRSGADRLSAAELKAANLSMKSLYAACDADRYTCGGDCDYALAGAGVMYTGHFHGKRVHDSMAVLETLPDMFRTKELHICDVGAGSGAALWAWALIACYLRDIKTECPVHNWTSIDSSPCMLEQNERLWLELCKVLPDVQKVVSRQVPICTDWRTQHTIPTGAVVIGGYLFSREDSTRHTRTARAFASTLQDSGAAAVVLWTAESKTIVMRRLIRQLKGWDDQSPKNLAKCPLDGRMLQCIYAAQSAFRSVALPIDTDWPQRYNWGSYPTKATALAMVRKDQYPESSVLEPVMK